jgi:hypothetical protein
MRHMCILTICYRLARQVKFEASWQREEKSTRKTQVLKYSVGKGMKDFSSEEYLDIEDPKSRRQHVCNYNSSKCELG